jgi:polysaccharide biosynthesis protein PslL
VVVSVRSAHIDVARGLGILLVVLGHNPVVSRPVKGELFELVFSFHMPLFFVLSGLFFDPTRSLRETLSTRADALLKPYAVTLAAVLLLGLGAGVSTPKQLVGAVYGAGALLPEAWIPLWFLPHLFVLSLASLFVARAFDRAGLGRVARASILLTLLFVGAQSLSWAYGARLSLGSIELALPGLPFGVDLLAVTLPYFLGAQLVRREILTLEPKLPVELGALALFAGSHLAFDGTIDLNHRVYTSGVVNTLQALTGSYLVLSLSRRLEGLPSIARALAAMGSASLFVLVFHAPLQEEAHRAAVGLLGVEGLVPDAMGFAAGALLPILLWAAAKRWRWLGELYLPRRRGSARAARERDDEGPARA